MLGDLSALPLITGAKSRSITAENPTGAPGGGATEEPEGSSPARRLGTGWKVRPCITLEPGSMTEIADIEGPGRITHIWITAHAKSYRDCILRFYWDDEVDPSVEVPLGDFFALGHGLVYNVNSLMVAVNPTGGMNSYWPMPFRTRCRITVESQMTEPLPGFFYSVDYELTDVDAAAAYFHAQWRRSVTTRELPEHVVVDGIEGRGHYVGTILAWVQMSDGWWGEGEVKFFLDGDEEHPTICGTGTEDYFGGAWGFGDTFSTPFLGYPLWQREPEKVPKHGLYRWHVLDPIRFDERLRVTVQALGWWPDGTFQPLTDDISSVALWYQTEPHAAFSELPPRESRWSR